MNFDDTPEEAAFRATVRAWIGANAPWHLEAALKAAAVPGFASIPGNDKMGVSRDWQRKKAAAGYAAPSWPTEYGGGGMSPVEALIWRQEEGAFHRLSTLFAIGFGMCGPTVMAWADDETKASLIPPMVRGDQIWCQLFSEPSAGSDLAGLRTSATPAADGSGDWIVSGQKIWTSGAQFADWGLLLCRTDPTVPKHKGLTMLYVDMRSPGVDIRPIRQMNGECDFNEVFFTDVRVPDTQRFGPVGQGWRVSLTTLMSERMTIGSNIQTGFAEIFELARGVETPTGPAIEDGAVRSRLANWAVDTSGLRYTMLRAASALYRGEAPGPESSIGKLVASEMRQDISMFAMDLLGPTGIVEDTAQPAFVDWAQANLLRSPAMRIEGGSDEILRNIIAERVLGLPGDIRVDKDVTFNRIPTAPG